MTIFENNFDYKKIIVIALAFVIIAGGFFIFFWKLNHNSAEDTDQTQPSNQLNSGRTIFECNQLSEPGRDFCYKDAGFGINANGGDLSLCDKISDSMVKNFCFKTMALQKKDASLCESISIATSSGKAAGGDVASKDECYQNIAIALKNKTLCANIIQVQYQCGFGSQLGFGTFNSVYCSYSQSQCEKKVENFICPKLAPVPDGFCSDGRIVTSTDFYGCETVPRCTR